MPEPTLCSLSLKRKKKEKEREFRAAERKGRRARYCAWLGEERGNLG